MTTSAVVYTFLFVHIGLVLVVTAYYTLGATLAPVLTQRSRLRFARRPWLPIALGMAISLPWVVAALVLLSLTAAPLKFAGAALLGLWVLCGLIGGAGIAQHVGRGGSNRRAILGAQPPRRPVHCAHLDPAAGGMAGHAAADPGCRCWVPGDGAAPLAASDRRRSLDQLNDARSR